MEQPKKPGIALAGLAIHFLATRCSKIFHDGPLITSSFVSMWSSLHPVGVAACYCTTVRSGTASLQVLPAGKTRREKTRTPSRNSVSVPVPGSQSCPGDGTLTLSASTSVSMRRAFFLQLLLFSSSSSLRYESPCWIWLSSIRALLKPIFSSETMHCSCQRSRCHTRI